MVEHEIALLDVETVAAVAESGVRHTERAGTVLLEGGVTTLVVVRVHYGAGHRGDSRIDVDFKEVVVRRSKDVDVVLERDRLVGVGVVEDERTVREDGCCGESILVICGISAIEKVDRERNATRGERGRGTGDDVHLSRAAADGGDETTGDAGEAAAAERHAVI